MTIVHYAKMRRAEICNATWSVWSRRLYDYIRPTQYSVYANIVWLRLIVPLKTLEDKSFWKNDFFRIRWPNQQCQCTELWGRRLLG